MEPHVYGKTILLVEDNAIIAMDESRMLAHLGYETVSVLSGEKAIEHLHVRNEVDLILMDIDLGKGMDGTECASAILTARDIPILFMTSHSEPEIVAKTEAIGSYGVIPKGTGEAVLNAAIKMAFRLFAEKQQRKEYEDSLFKSNQMLRKIIDSVHQSIFWKDTDGTYLGCNKTFANTVRIENPEDVAGMTDFDMPWPESEADAYREDDREVIRTGISKLHIIEPVLGADGVHRIVDTSKHPLFNENGTPFGVIGIYNDITEIRRAREYLREKDSALTKLASQVPGMLYEFLMKPDGSFLVPYSSQGIVELFGCTPEEVEHDFNPIGEAIIPEDRPVISSSIRESAKNLSQWKLEYRVQLPGGPVKWIYGNSIPELQDDGSIKWYGYNVDISQQKLAEQEIKEQLKSKVTLLREVHHRIKNNFASITSLLSIQSNATDNPAVHEALQQAQGRIESVQLLYSTLLSGDEYETLLIKGYLEELVRIILNIFQEELDFTVSMDVCDFQILSRKAFPLGIIINELITNIIKYAFPNGKKGNVGISLKKTDLIAELIIRDDGIGIDPGKITGGASGFGISLVSMLSEQMGGSFSIRNENGTVTTVTFPIEAKQSS